MRLKERWNDLPIRLRAGLSALFLVLALLLLWWLSGWAWPTQTLAHRALEREHLFGHGEIVGGGAITLSDEEAHSASGGTHFLVSEKDGRYAVSVLRPKWWIFWRSAQDVYWPFQVLAPTEKAPLAYSFLASEPTYEVSAGAVRTAGWEYLLLVVSADPHIVRVEVTMDLFTREDLERDPDQIFSSGVTVSAGETEPGSGLWLAPLSLDKTGGTTRVLLRGYDAAGALVYDYTPQ